MLVQKISCQEEYVFDEVLEYDFIDLKKEKKWKWMQFHNSNDNSYRASVHVEENNEYWFNLTFSDSPRHVRFQMDNYVLGDGFKVLVNENLFHNNNLPKGIRISSTSIYQKKNFTLKPLEFNNNSSKVRFEIKPKNERIQKRNKLSSLYYEIDISMKEHELNFIRQYVKQLYKKEFKHTKGLITKRCEINADGEIIKCINLKEKHLMKSYVVIED